MIPEFTGLAGATELAPTVQRFDHLGLAEAGFIP
jgi:hypothetical protein